MRDTAWVGDTPRGGKFTQREGHIAGGTGSGALKQAPAAQRRNGLRIHCQGSLDLTPQGRRDLWTPPLEFREWKARSSPRAHQFVAQFGDERPAIGWVPEEQRPGRRLLGEDVQPNSLHRRSRRGILWNLWGNQCHSPDTVVHTREVVVQDPYISVMESNWSRAYGKCPVWGPVYGSVQVTAGDWPERVSLYQDKMSKDRLLCEPTFLMGLVVRAHHRDEGNLGFIRLWHQMGRCYRFADPRGLRNSPKSSSGNVKSAKSVTPLEHLSTVLSKPPL